MSTLSIGTPVLFDPDYTREQIKKDAPANATVPGEVIRFTADYVVVEVTNETHGKRTDWRNTDTYGSIQIVHKKAVIAK